MSPLTRGRGSKRGGPVGAGHVHQSPLTRGRGSKRSAAAFAGQPPGVAPHAGARIETRRVGHGHARAERRPSRGGADRNKLRHRNKWPASRRPSRGGADRNLPLWQLDDAGRSPLTRGRGSKRSMVGRAADNRGRPSRGGADRNPWARTWAPQPKCRPSRGGADRNNNLPLMSRHVVVAPHAGARIETDGDTRRHAQPQSPLTRGRGSKRPVRRTNGNTTRRPSRGGADRNSLNTVSQVR